MKKITSITASVITMSISDWYQGHRDVTINEQDFEHKKQSYRLMENDRLNTDWWTKIDKDI